MFVCFINFHQCMTLQNVSPSWPEVEWGQFKPTLSFFFAITQKVFELGSSNFLTFLTKTYPSLKAKYWN